MSRSDRLYERKKGSGRPADLGTDDTGFFSMRLGDQLIGCGALIRHPDYGELKRFYLREQFQAEGWGASCSTLSLSMPRVSDAGF